MLDSTKVMQQFETYVIASSNNATISSPVQLHANTQLLLYDRYCCDRTTAIVVAK